MTDRWVILDVGETLIDETRVWSAWADALGIPRLTFLAGLGAVIARGGSHPEVFALFGSRDWQERRPQLEAAYGGFTEADVYPDAHAAFDRLRELGYRLAILANQPAKRTAELRALGFDPEVMAMSEEMGVAKPAPAFFERALELLGSPLPASVAYVGDRIDNDVLPSIAAGLRAVWIRRGPWGIIERVPPGARPALVVDTLAELAERILEAWEGLPAADPAR
jgi:HAD superfamily hydrolase (TIGR01549 family)